MTIETMDDLCFIYINARSLRKLSGQDSQNSTERAKEKKEAEEEWALLLESQLNMLSTGNEPEYGLYE